MISGSGRKPGNLEKTPREHKHINSTHCDTHPPHTGPWSCKMHYCGLLDRKPHGKSKETVAYYAVITIKREMNTTDILIRIKVIYRHMKHILLL